MASKVMAFTAVVVAEMVMGDKQNMADDTKDKDWRCKCTEAQKSGKIDERRLHLLKQ